jgi:adenosylhomocysteine nucleosidase
MRIAVFSAFPQELRQIARYFGARKHSRKGPFAVSSALSSSHEILLVQSGIGPLNAETAVNYIFKAFNPNYVVSVGFGGALYDEAVTGELTWAPKVLSLKEKGIESFEIPDARAIAERLSGKILLQEKCVLTVDRWMKKSEIKKVFPGDASLLVCDMETFPLAKFSIQRGIPFFAIRSITDPADEEIPPELVAVCDVSGNYRLSCALRLLLRKPHLVPKIIKLGRNSYRASRNLALAVKSLIDVL